MIILGGSENVVAQWFTKRFINKQAGLFKGVVIGPGECAIVIRNGKAEKPVTQEQFKGVSTGLLDSIKTRLGGGDDFQMLVVDVRPKVISLPFQGYSKDRSKIEGTVHITFRIAPQSATNIIYMMTGPTVLDQHLAGRSGMTAGTEDQKDVDRSEADIRQLTIEQVAARLGPDLESKLYAEVISQTDAADFHEKALVVTGAVQAVVERSSPFWSEYGLEVVDQTCKIGVNAHEDDLREEAEAARAQGKRVRSIARAKALEKERTDIGTRKVGSKQKRAFYLIYIDSQNQEKSFEIDSVGSIFRDQETDEVMVTSDGRTTSLNRHDQTVSRHPISFVCEDKKAFILDDRKDGRNHTCINGQPLPKEGRRELFPGDMVRIGCALIFRIEWDLNTVTVRDGAILPISKEMAMALDQGSVIQNNKRFYLNCTDVLSKDSITMGNRRVLIGHDRSQSGESLEKRSDDDG